MVCVITCSKCGGRKHMQNAVLYKHLQKNRMSSIEEFGRIYECRGCRPRKPKRVSQFKYNAALFKPFRQISEFRKLRDVLQHQVDIHIERGIGNRDAQRNFVDNVKAIMDKYFIKSYDYFVVDGKLCGIILHNVPFIGDYLIGLKVDKASEKSK